MIEVHKRKYTYRCAFTVPYTQKGVIRGYLKILVAMMDNKKRTRKDILKIMGHEPRAGLCSCVFADMDTAKLKGYRNGWLQGENYAEYMKWVAQKLLQDKKLRLKYPHIQKLFKTISKKYLGNGINFILNSD